MLTPEQLSETAAQLAAAERSLITTTERVADRCASLDRIAAKSVAWWVGRRSDTYRTNSTSLTEPLRPLPAAVGGAARTIASTGRLADDLATRLAAIDRGRSHQLGLLHRYRRDVDHLWSTPADEARACVAVRSFDRQRADVEVEWSLQSRATAAAVGHSAATLPVLEPSSGFASMPLGPTSGVLRSGMQLDQMPDPRDVAAWWAGLTPAARRATAATIPMVIGNLDGIAFADRITANRRAMQEALDEAEPGSELRERMQQFTTIDGRIDPTRRFLVFDPAGDGLIAEAFGDIATADHVAVMVPGMGSTMAGFHDLAGRGARLHAESGRGTAVVAWTGYDTPHAPAPTPRAFEVVSDRQAVRGGKQLHDFIAGIQTQSGAPLTLIGHSYGSLTVGKALHRGTQIDRVVFMGSPGVDANHVDDFPAGAADEFFASEIRGDIVANLEHYGSNPTDPDFGAEVFDSGDGDGADPFTRHGEYYDRGIAIENLATILTGGSPTPGRTDAVEYITEPLEDVGEAVHIGVDRLQEFDVPILDDSIVDQATEVGQRVGGAVSQIGEIVIEEVGHFGQDAVEWGVDRAGDAMEWGVDRAGDAVEWGVDRAGTAATWGVDRTGDAAEWGVDLVTGWFR